MSNTGTFNPFHLFALQIVVDDSTDRVTLIQERPSGLNQVVLHRSQLEQVIEWLIEIADGDLPDPDGGETLIDPNAQLVKLVDDEELAAIARRAA